MKNKKILIYLSTLVGSILLLDINSYAKVSVKEYNLTGVPTEFIDKESPPAYKITGSSYFPDGTILYKQVYKDITYYAPNPPLGSDEANGVSKNYVNWGFWDFSLNQKVYKYGKTGADKLFESHYYYPQVKILKKTLVESSNGKDGANSVDIGYVNAGTVLNVLSITKQTYGTEIFFRLNQISGMSSGTNVGKIMVSSNNVQFLGNKIDIYFSESANRSNKCRYYTDNFKPYTKPVNMSGNEAHNDLVLTKNYTESESSKVPDGTSVGGCSIGGRYGEWRYLGLNSTGTPVVNPYFPSDQLSYRGNSDLSSYDWRKTPWNGTDKEDSKEKDPVQNADAFVKQYNAPTTFDSSGYLERKKQTLKKLYDNGILSTSDWTLGDFANRVSLLTHPTKETAVFVGQRKGGAWDKMFMIKNPTRDLYIASIRVKDKSGTVILEGSGSYTDKSFKQIREGKLKKGEEYTVQVVLGNAKGLELSVEALSAQMGTVNGSSSSPRLTLPYSMTHNKIGLQSLKGRGGIKAQVGSLSSPFEFKLLIPENYSSPHIDIYGYVGKYHSGVDNLNYNNDTGALRGIIYSIPQIPETPKDELPEDLGDLMAYQVELYDGSTLVYRRDYTGTVSVKKAIIPSKKYKIKYTAKYTGDDLWDYIWIEPYYKEVEVWVPGYWKEERYWVPGHYAYHDVWVNGYTNSDGEWVPGYWKEEEYWVSGYYSYYDVWVSGYWDIEYELVPGYWKEDKISEYTVPLKYTITRKVGKSQSQDSKTFSGYFRTASGSTSIPMEQNTYLYFETDEVMFEHPYMYTSFTINTTNSRFNPYTKNDTLSATINDTFDIGISNLRVIPNTEYTDGKNKLLSHTVVYDAYLETPSYVSNSDYQAYIDTSINIGGTTFDVADVLIKGENKNITHIIDNVNISGNISSYITNVVLNYNKESYESGNYTNNSSSVSTKLEQINNPSSGNKNSTASSVNNSNNNSSPNRGGDANNNCLVPRTKNTFSSTYAIRKWNSNPMSYTTFNTGSNISFNKYYTESTTTKTSQNTESLEITKVMFSSKDTKDKKLGSKKDGWINLLDASEDDLALIKAGYGFELKVNVEYKTNALLNNPSWSASKKSGTSVTNVSSGINIIPELFIELPGDNNRKILSVSGYKDSVQGLLVNKIKDKKVEDGYHVYSWEYTIKPTNTVGVKEVGKVFIPETMKNGKYKISIYTPPVTGVSSLPEYSTSKYSALCDRKDVNIEVKGSYLDDLNSHHTQD